MEGDTNTDTTPVILLNRYRVEGPLGKGVFGTVVKAFDTRIKRMVAIKTLNHSVATDPEHFRALQERFTREAEAASRMGIHQNIVAVHDLASEPDGTLYLILEYIAGGTLLERLKQGTLTLRDALRFTADAARGLDAAHVNGVVHRDIKPANVFLSLDGRAQIGDFGIAQIDDLSGRTRTTTGHPGTPLYMSPEQQHLSAYVRPFTDQYSLGLVLFEMLTSKAYKRLELSNAEYLLQRQPLSLIALFRRMTMEQSDHRYPSMDKVAAAIRAVEEELDRSGQSQGTIQYSAFKSENDVTQRALNATPNVVNEQWSHTSRGKQPTPPSVAQISPFPGANPRRALLRRRALLVSVGGFALAVGGTGGLFALRGHDAVRDATGVPISAISTATRFTQSGVPAPTSPQPPLSSIDPTRNQQVTVGASTLTTLSPTVAVSVSNNTIDVASRNGKYKSPPPITIDKSKKYTVTIATNKGTMKADLFADTAPITVNNSVFLANDHFYDGVIFHRIVAGFVIQGGDPTGMGKGGPGYMFPDEPIPASRSYEKGTLAMANSGPNTNGSQFFICLDNLTAKGALPKQYNLFGKVAEGLDVIDKILAVPRTAGSDGAQSKPTEKVFMESVTIQTQ